MRMNNYTTLQEVWYQHFTGIKGKRKHLELKLVCTECHCVWDKQAFAFHFCPGCGKKIVEVEEDAQTD